MSEAERQLARSRTVYTHRSDDAETTDRWYCDTRTRLARHSSPLLFYDAKKFVVIESSLAARDSIILLIDATLTFWQKIGNEPLQISVLYFRNIDTNVTFSSNLHIYSSSCYLQINTLLDTSWTAISLIRVFYNPRPILNQYQFWYLVSRSEISRAIARKARNWKVSVSLFCGRRGFVNDTLICARACVKSEEGTLSEDDSVVRALMRRIIYGALWHG